MPLNSSIHQSLPLEKLPEYWKDESRLNVLFGPFRNRNVNPKDWETKLEFWKQSIRIICSENSLHSFKLHDLQQAFAYNGRMPTCLDIVFEDMVKNKEIITMQEFLSKPSQTWSGWAANVLVKKPLLWSFNKVKSTIVTPSITETTFICVAAVQDQCSKLSSKIPATHKNKVLDIKKVGELIDCTDTGTLKLLLSYMEKNGEVAVKEVVHKNGSEAVVLVKFSSKKGDPISESDVDAYMLAQTEKILLETVENLENEVMKLRADAKNHLVKGHRQLAKSCLKKKHDLEKRIDARTNALYNVQTLLLRVEDASHDAHVLETYKHALDSLRSNFNDNKLNEESVTNTMIEIGEVLDIHNDIQSSLAQPIDESDADLEAELEELLVAEDDNTVPKPSNISPKPNGDEKQDDKALADLIKGLELPDVPQSDLSTESTELFS